MIKKSDDRAAGVRFVYHEYDYRPNWTTINHKNYTWEERKIAKCLLTLSLFKGKKLSILKKALISVSMVIRTNVVIG